MINLKLRILFNKYSNKVLFCSHFHIYFYIYSSSIFKPIDVNLLVFFCPFLNSLRYNSTVLVVVGGWVGGGECVYQRQ